MFGKEEIVFMLLIHNSHSNMSNSILLKWNFAYINSISQMIFFCCFYIFSIMNEKYHVSWVNRQLLHNQRQV